jgi:uncharacterized C2H2 Zn-finger protein
MENLQKKIFSCYECGKLFKQKEGLSRHKRTAHGNSKWKCDQCDVSFTSAILKNMKLLFKQAMAVEIIHRNHVISRH